MYDQHDSADTIRAWARGQAAAVRARLDAAGALPAPAVLLARLERKTTAADRSEARARAAAVRQRLSG